MSSDEETSVLKQAVDELAGRLSGSDLLDEVAARLGCEVSANTLMWYVFDHQPGRFDLAYSLVKARYLHADRETVDQVMEQIRSPTLLSEPDDS